MSNGEEEKALPKFIPRAPDETDKCSILFPDILVFWPRQILEEKS